MTHERAAAEAEALPRFNEHAQLPWRWVKKAEWEYSHLESEFKEPNQFAKSGFVHPIVIDAMEEDYKPYMEIDDDNAAFILHACNTYYDRLSALSAKEQEVRELVEALRSVVAESGRMALWANVNDERAAREELALSTDEECYKVSVTKANELLSKHPQP